MNQEYFWSSGMWIFPTAMIVIMLIVITILKSSKKKSISCCGSSDTDKSKANVDDESAIEILKKRYAKGEITKEEFLQIKEDLSNL